MRRRSALGALASLAMLGCARKTARQQVTIGLAIASHVHAVAWIAKDRGLFEAAGLDADVQVMGGSAAAIRALIAGQIEIALAGGDSVLKASWAGADLAVVAGLVDRFYHRIVARRGIERGSDLRGKKLGLPFLGGPQDMAAKYALAQLGLAYGKDVEIVSLGKDMNLLAALERGEIDAATAELPKARLARRGLRVIADLPESPVKFPYLVVAARSARVREQPLCAQGVLGALCAATSWYRDPKHRDASLEIVGRHLRSTDRSLLLELHDAAGPSWLTSSLRPSRAAFETAIELAGRGAGDETRLDRLLETGPLEALHSQGRCA